MLQSKLFTGLVPIQASSAQCIVSWVTILNLTFGSGSLQEKIATALFTRIQGNTIHTAGSGGTERPWVTSNDTVATTLRKLLVERGADPSLFLSVPYLRSGQLVHACLAQFYETPPLIR